MKTEFSQACPTCKSSNNLKFFKTDSGRLSSKCMTPGCPGKSDKQQNEHKAPYVVNKKTVIESDLITTGQFNALEDRGLTEETCRVFNYQVGTHQNRPIHIANYLGKSDVVTCQKIRYLDNLPGTPKEMAWRNHDKERRLFGQDTLNKSLEIIYITEGEIDCMTLYQAGFNAVSISTGAGDQTAGEINRHLKFLEQYDRVVLVFDTDEVGFKTQKEIAKLFTPGKCFKVSLRFKDPNEYLKLKQLEELKKDLTEVELCRPDNLAVPTLAELLTPTAAGKHFKFTQLSNLIKGIKPGRIYTLLAGSGVGKTTFTKEVVKSLVDKYPEFKVGVAYLEEPTKTSAQSFLALAGSVPLHEFEDDPTMLGDAVQGYYDKYVKPGCQIQYVDASFMALESAELVYTLNWLAVAEGCQLIVLDHLTMVTYDMNGEQSERKDIDMLMKALRQLTYKTQCSILLISHLKRPGFGKSWAEGREVQMTDARGSAAIEQLSDVMLALERNTVDDALKNKTRTKVMKNRVTGKTGYTDELYQNEKTGRMETLTELFEDKKSL